MPVYLFKRPRLEMHAGKLKDEIVHQLNLYPIQGPVYCEQAGGLFHLDERGHGQCIGPATIRVDSELGDIQVARDFSFGNGVTVDAVKTREGKWVHAVWIVFSPETQPEVDKAYERLRQIVASHKATFAQTAPKRPPRTKYRVGSHWSTWRSGADNKDGKPRVDILSGKDGFEKHAHLILKGKRMLIGESERDVPPETFSKRFISIIGSDSGFTKYTYINKERGDIESLSENAWPASTTSNAPVDLGFMSITI